MCVGDNYCTRVFVVYLLMGALCLARSPKPALYACSRREMGVANSVPCLLGVDPCMAYTLFFFQSGLGRLVCLCNRKNVLHMYQLDCEQV